MQKAIRFIPTTFLTLALLFTAFSASALSGIPPKFTIGSTPLTLNGAGERTKFIITVYNAGLFLKKKSSDANQIINANEPMVIRIKVVSGFATAEKIKASLYEGFKKSTNGKTAPIQAQIDQILNAAFTAKVNKGDTFDLVYTPAAGTQVVKNSKVLTAVKGMPFKKALFGIWLSDKPAQVSLKKQMLGQG